MEIVFNGSKFTAFIGRKTNINKSLTGINNATKVNTF